ncbi:NADH-quinone oxidoreductase subunit NuoH [Candidatus Poribacteria bacterium]|nr:NADH-quinone oxidoreductase subunit NuoH [Candidatus Poribacteria bacterium]
MVHQLSTQFFHLASLLSVGTVTQSEGSASSGNWAQAFASQFLGFLPDWIGLVLVMSVVAAVFVAIVPLVPLVLVLMERKVSAWIQDRVGPMRVGPWGLLQTLADGVKLIFKEDLIPPQADKFLFRFAPYLIFTCSFAVFAAIPFGQRILVSDLNIGIFYIISISSVVAIGVIIAGWSSNSKWSLFGAMRSAAQMVSYEIPMGLSILTVIMMTQTMSMAGIVAAQNGAFAQGEPIITLLGVEVKGTILDWMIFRSPFTFLAFFVYFLSSIAEVNRTPFDLPEAESELVAGFHTEYSGMRFAVFFIAEYANMFAVCAIAATLFLGGWQGIIDEDQFIPGLFIIGGKTFLLVFVMMWIRWTLPRLRVDQLMNLCWKYLIPIAFFNILGTGIWGLFFREDSALSIGLSFLIISLFVVSILGIVFNSFGKLKPADQTALAGNIGAANLQKLETTWKERHGQQK